ncbi:MAG: S1 RNA-binding domain-containing protein [Pirellulales bacterium]
MEILRKMLTAIPRPRSETSRFAPRLLRTKIDPEKIGLLIGPGGKNIRAIQEQTGATIDVEDDGTVVVASANADGAKAAMARVEACTATAQIGKIYDGIVSSVRDFGAFVEILPGRDGLVHISELSNGYVSSVDDVCQVGDQMKVLVIDIDEQDRVKLSRRRALEELGVEDPFAQVGEEGDGSEERVGRWLKEAIEAIAVTEVIVVDATAVTPTAVIVAATEVVDVAVAVAVEAVVVAIAVEVVDAKPDSTVSH